MIRLLVSHVKKQAHNSFVCVIWIYLYFCCEFHPKKRSVLQEGLILDDSFSPSGSESLGGCAAALQTCRTHYTLLLFRTLYTEPTLYSSCSAFLLCVYTVRDKDNQNDCLGLCNNHSDIRMTIKGNGRAVSGVPENTSLYSVSSSVRCLSCLIV